MRFADYAKTYVTAGDGGDGCVHFRREKYVPRGGPDGGDGGDGGSVILKGNPQLNTLLDLRYKKFIKAEDGHRGEGSRKSGKNGKSEVLEVPLGSVVYNAETKERIGEITEADEELLIAKGGKGGQGNWHYRSPTNQAPRKAEEGKPGEEITIEIELKLIADVGLVGFPNAGKSTLLSVFSAAKPKIASYPFTTLQPNLGVITMNDYRSFVMADIPGIIEEAHEGKGLGLQFLRHIERNKMLLIVISAASDIEYEYRALLDELKSYRSDLLDKPRLVALSKADLIQDYKLESPPDIEEPWVLFSSATGYNTDVLKNEIWNRLSKTEKSDHPKN